MSILAQQLQRPMIKPRWQAPLGVMESVVAYNCRKHGFPVPVLALPIWEGAGNKVYDVSGKRNHGILGSTTKWQQGCILFDGTANSYITHPVSASLHPTANISVACLFKANTLSGYNDIITKTTVDGDNNWFIESSDTNFEIAFTDTAHSPTAGLVTNKWYHIIVTYSDTNNRVVCYLNGVSILSEADSYSMRNAATNHPLQIGRGWAGEEFPGNINNPIIFSDELTRAQAKFLYDNPYFMYEMPEELWGYAAAVGGYTLSVDSGSLALAGTIVGLRAARKILVASGALSLSGTGVGLLAFRKLLIASGSIALAGTDVNLVYTPAGAYVLTASSGALSLAGTPVGLLAARKISIASGSLTLSGTAVQTLKGSKIEIASGSLTLTGTDVDLLALRKLIAASGSLILTGTAVGLEYSGEAVPFPLLITITKDLEYSISILKDTEYNISISKLGG